MSSTSTLVRTMAALGLCNIATGLFTQVIPVAMERDGFSAGAIGLNSAAGQFGLFLAGALVPHIVTRVPGEALMRAAILLFIGTQVVFAATAPMWGWTAARFATGLAIAPLFAVSEGRILASADMGWRGRVMSIFMSMLTVTYGLGPLIMPLTGADTWMPWLVGGLFAAAGLAVSERAAAGAAPQAPSSGFMNLLAKAPFVFLCTVAAALLDAIFNAFFTVFALRSGLDLASAGRLTAFTIIGCLALYYPLGQLADHWSKRGTVALGALLSIAASLALAPAIGTPWALPCAILMRGAAFGAYTIAISMSGERFARHELVTSRALTAILWGAAGMIGPPLAGAAIDLVGIGLLPGLLALCFVPVLAVQTIQWIKPNKDVLQ